MLAIQKKAEERLKTQVKKYKKPLEDALTRDVNESDTVTLITDMLSDVFGWDKYTDLTSEYAIRSTFCDIAVKYEDSVWMLLEAKAIGLELKENHLRQAVNYAANEGIDWVVLTNGLEWKIFKIIFAKPVNYELFAEINFLNINTRSQHDMETLFVLCKEGVKKGAINRLFEESQLTNKYVLSALVQSDQVLNLLRKEIRRINKNVKVEPEDLRNTLVAEVLKREVIEGEKLENAKRIVKKSQRSRK